MCGARSSLSPLVSGRPPRVAQLVFKSPLLSLMTVLELRCGDAGHPDVPQRSRSVLPVRDQMCLCETPAPPRSHSGVQRAWLAEEGPWGWSGALA